MAFFTIDHISIRGISAVVPQKKVSNHELEGYEIAEKEKLISTLGIEQRRVASKDQCASDLCVAAANKLISELGWEKSEVEVLFFVSQTPDFLLPGTSVHLQERLGLPKSCATFDINQGCAGYVYGLSLISSFMSASGLKKGILLVGDTITKLISPFDQSLVPIFSDCGTATALVFDTDASPISFNIGSEGAAFDAIIVPDGGSRQTLDGESLKYHDFEGNIKRKGIHLVMKGLDVFNFSLKKVSPNVEELFQKTNQQVGDIDYFVFHQANRLIIESLSKKLKIDPGKVPSSLKNYGNTSGATIPLTIVSELAKNNHIRDLKLLLCGFGVGLSLASSIVELKNVCCPEITEL